MSRQGVPAGVGTTAEAIAVTAEAVATRETRLAKAVSDRVMSLRAAGAEVVEISRPGARDRGDVMREILGDLSMHGIGSGLVLLVGSRFGGPGADAALLVPEGARMTVVSVGEEPCGVPAGVIGLGGGARALLALLDEQLRRRACLRVPEIDEDPAWTLVEAGDDPARRRVTESLFTLGAAGLATRGSVEETVPGGQPLVLAAGIYTGTGAAQHLLPGPAWTGLAIEPAPHRAGGCSTCALACSRGRS